MSPRSVAREAAGVKRTVLMGQRAMDALALHTFALVDLATATGLREHARLATQAARLAADLHQLNEQLAAGGVEGQVAA